MKKLISALLLLFLLCSLCACGGKKNQIAFEDVFCLTFCDGILCKLDTKGGTLTPLCNDPLCDHTLDSGCPLSGYFYGTVWEGSLYFAARDSVTGDAEELRAYDFDSSKVRIVCRLPDMTGTGGGSFCFRGGYYCCNWASRDDPDFERHFAVNLKTGKIKDYGNDEAVIAGTADTYYKKKPVTITFEEDKIHAEIRYGDDTVLYAGELAIAFTDQLLDGKLLYGVYYRDENGRVNTDEMSLYTLDLDTGENKMFCKKFNDVYFALIGDYMYYVRYVENPPVLGYDKNNKRDAVNTCGGVIWRMNTETGEEERFLEIPEYRFYGTEIKKVGDRFLIGYRNTDYSHWTEDIGVNGSVWYEYPETNGWIIVNPADRTWIDVPAILDDTPCENVRLIQ